MRTPFYPEGASVGTHPKVSRKFPGALERTRGPPIPKRPIGTARSLLPKSVADARSRAVAGGPPCQCPGQCLTPEPSAGTATLPSFCRNPSPPLPECRSRLLSVLVRFRPGLLVALLRLRPLGGIFSGAAGAAVDAGGEECHGFETVRVRFCGIRVFVRRT